MNSWIEAERIARSRVAPGRGRRGEFCRHPGRRSEKVSRLRHKMDPLGFGLENHDGIGEWRAMDGKFPVDSSGTLPNGKSFATPAAMRAELLSALPQFANCMVEKMLTYSLGRGLAPYLCRTVDAITRNLSASGHPFQSIIFEIVRSLPFQSRRGEAVVAHADLQGASKR